MEGAALEAVEWWAYQEPRAQLSATLVDDIAGVDADWTIMVEVCEDCSFSHARVTERRIVLRDEVVPLRMPGVIAHEMGHVFGANDLYPECEQGMTIMCSALAYHWPNPVSDETRQAIGWGDFTVYKTYMPMVMH